MSSQESRLDQRFTDDLVWFSDQQSIIEPNGFVRPTLSSLVSSRKDQDEVITTFSVVDLFFKAANRTIRI